MRKPRPAPPRGFAKTVQRFEAGSERLAELLATLRADFQNNPKIGTGGGQEPHGAVEEQAALGETDVDRLLSDGQLVNELLRRLQALEDMEKRWRDDLGRVQAALARYAEDPDAPAGRPPRERDRAVPSPLCEADDDFWYL